MEGGEAARPDHVMAIDAGPELLTGSTRLKAGTAPALHDMHSLPHATRICC